MTLDTTGAITSATNITATGTATTGGLTCKASCTVANTLGVGTTAPESALHVVGLRNNTPTTVGIHMGFFGTNYAIEMCSADVTTQSFIDFTYVGQDMRGRLIYSHAANTMIFYTSALQRLTIDGNGNTLCGADLAVATNLYVGGDVEADSYSSTVPSVYYGQLDSFTSYLSGNLFRYTGGTVVNPRALYTAASYSFTAPRACYVDIFCQCYHC